MRIAGVIAEYNPFHNGHAGQLAELRRRGFEAVVTVCSPGVVQRGEPALFPTPVRAGAALAGGADLVLSLPAPYALKSAEGFAAAGVSLLTALGCVDTLCFGAETLTGDHAMEIARLMESEAFTAALRERLAAGLPLAAARAAAADLLREGAGEALRNPNDILAVEYCKAILRQKSPLRPLALLRVGAAHDAPLSEPRGQSGAASASALRALCREKGVDALAPFVPAACMALYRAAWERGAVLSGDSFSVAALSRLRAMDAASLRRVRGVREGLENRLQDAARQACSWIELIDLMKTKRYATARLRRLALNAALGFTEDLPALPPYLHVLGASEAGLAVLRGAKETARLPLSHSLRALAKSGEDAARAAAAHAAAEDFTALCLRAPAPMGTAYSEKMIRLSDDGAR